MNWLIRSLLQTDSKLLSILPVIISHKHNCVRFSTSSQSPSNGPHRPSPDLESRSRTTAAVRTTCDQRKHPLVVVSSCRCGSRTGAPSGAARRGRRPRSPRTPPSGGRRAAARARRPATPRPTATPTRTAEGRAETARQGAHTPRAVVDWSLGLDDDEDDEDDEDGKFYCPCCTFVHIGIFILVP